MSKNSVLYSENYFKYNIQRFHFFSSLFIFPFKNIFSEEMMGSTGDKLSAVQQWRYFANFFKKKLVELIKKVD